MIIIQRVCPCGTPIDERTIVEEQDMDDGDIHIVGGWLMVRMKHLRCKKCIDKMFIDKMFKEARS